MRDSRALKRQIIIEIVGQMNDEDGFIDSIETVRKVIEDEVDIVVKD